MEYGIKESDKVATLIQCRGFGMTVVICKTDVTIEAPRCTACDAQGSMSSNALTPLLCTRS